jgi:hypothetical protein
MFLPEIFCTRSLTQKSTTTNASALAPQDSKHFVPRPEGPCPKGAGGLSPGFQPGFNPGNRRPERFALKLKGRQIERTNNAKVGPIVQS